MKTFKTAKGTELPIMDIKGKDYLQAAPRIFWMKEEHPDWSIQTEFLVLNDKVAVCKATVSQKDGQILATGTSMETVQGFESFVEKAETCAISRAASFCGYGTLMAQELEEQGKLAETPQERKPSSQLQNIGGQVLPISGPAKAATSSALDSALCPFGSNKDKTFAEVGKPALAKDRTYWLAKLRETGEEPRGRLKQYLEEINAYLGQ